MEESRTKKIETGREKLEAYKKKKHKSSKGAGSSSDSSSSPSLPIEKDTHSDSSISEHVISSGGSIENDRSFQEIIIANIPLTVNSEDEVDHISQEVKPPSFLSYKSDSLSGSGGNEVKHVQSILEEILKNEQFVSDSEHTVFNKSHDSSLNIFENVNLDDESLNYMLRRDGKNESGLESKVKNLEELVAAKDAAIAVLTAELDSIRDLNSNPSTFSLGTTTTEYKQIHEECYGRIVEYQNAIAYKDSLIQRLTDSLEQSHAYREELTRQTEIYAAEIANLQKQVVEAASNISKHKCFRDEPRSFTDCDTKDVNLEEECSKMETKLDPSQKNIFDGFKNKIYLYVESKMSEKNKAHQDEIKILQDRMANEKQEQTLEINRLRELLSNIKCGSTEIMELKQQLEAKHAREMEDLRIFFEKKCAEMEKHYSEEVFSQQSRKMSGSSTGSDVELTSDLLFSGSHPHPGPGGDSGQLSFEAPPLKQEQNALTSQDLILLKRELSNILTDLEKYDLNNLSKHDMGNLTSLLNKYDLRGLVKYDLSSFRTEMQNKYHAELEILREDYEDRLDRLNIEHGKQLQSIERKYIDKIENLKYELDEALKGHVSISSAVQEVGSSGEFEISEVVQSYERRLQEQVTLAKYDIITALECQIQRLAANEGDDEEWPSELLQLRDRFTEKYEAEIADLKVEHEKEISQLKEEHRKILNGALERARRRSLKDGESFNKEEQELIKERDTMKKSNKILRHLMSELIKYFTQCEDELNNTLVDELLRHGFEKNLTQIEGELSIRDSLTSDEIKRVHLAPDFTEFMSVIDGSNPSSLDSTDISVELKNELGSCLEKLKADANAILALTNNLQGDKDDKESGPSEDKMNSLTRQLINETQLKNDLKRQYEEVNDYVRNLEADKENLEAQIEQFIAKQVVLEAELGKAKEKILELIESKEVVTEGYGESFSAKTHSSGDKPLSLMELYEKARAVVAELTSNPDHPLVHLIEDLCHEGERIREEAKKDHDDLIQQIEAADKKYKAICHFLEEQASEREQERDEAQKEIASLHEQLKNRDKDRASCERINDEWCRQEEDFARVDNNNKFVRTIEQLERQMVEMSKIIELNELKYQETDKERRDAIEKIGDLRGIICNLEAQIESKIETEAELRIIINELENLVKQQTKSNEELSEQLDSIKTVPDAHQFQEHITHLEGEVQRLRLNTELAGSEGAVKQVINQLTDIEVLIEKQTKELEGLHSTISTTSCSSPSEDMSIKDQVRSRTPISALEECEVPLQQLARLREKLIKHSRAEDAAIKRIRDLEMQLITSRHEFEEALHEKDILQEQVSEQMMLISSLQIRLDEQRLLVENAEKQTNSSLEMRIYDLENDVQNLQETIHKRDKTIKQLSNTLEETKKRLEERENEIRQAKEDDKIIALKMKMETLMAENATLRAAAESTQILPNLVDNILADKNADIEKLREQLNETQKQLDEFLSLNLDREQLLNLSKLKSSERGFSNILSLIDLDEPEQMRRAESRNTTMGSPFRPNFNESTKFEPEISSIEKTGPPNINYTFEAPLPKPNSTEVYQEKRVRFDDIEKLQAEIVSLKNDSHKKDEVIKEYSERLKLLANVEDNIRKLQENLESTEKALKQATETFEMEQNELKKAEQNLRMELAEKKMYLSESEQKLTELTNECERKDQICMNLAKEKIGLENKIKELENDPRLVQLETDLQQKITEIELLEEKIVDLEKLLNRKGDEYESLKHQNELEVEKNTKLLKELKNMETQTDSLNEEVQKLVNLVDEKSNEIALLENEISRLKNNHDVSESELQLKISQNLKEGAEKDLLYTKLKADYDGLSKEKDRIIQQMNEDSKSLHINLETIQNKMLETGNILDLSKRLRDELKLNAELQEEIQNLKSMFLQQDAGKMTTSIEEMTGQVRRELDYSAQLDSSIINALNTDNFDLMDLETLKVSLRKERALNRDLIKQKESLQMNLHDLEAQVEVTKSKIVHLQKELEKERLNSNEIQLEDAKLIEQLRIRLDTAIDNQDEFEKVIQSERKARLQLESQIAALKDRTTNLNSSSNSKTEQTQYKSLPNMELAQLKNELQVIKDENAQLKSDVKLLKRSKTEEENNHRYTKDILNLKNAEVAKLEKQIKEMSEAGDALKEKNIALKIELEQKTREVENSRILIDEIEEDRIEMKKQIDGLNKRVREYKEREKRFSEALGNDHDPLSSPVPDQVLRKIIELSDLVKDNKKINETLAKLTDERKVLQERIKYLEGQRTNVPFDDPVARANHLFGRYLRSESYRKALIWQKRYLIALLATYQDFRPITDNLPLHNFSARLNKRRRCSGKSRFRSIVVVIISTLRLKFLVQRWHSGKRYVKAVNARYGGQQNSRPTVTQFQVGQPVSSQHFSSRPFKNFDTIQASQRVSTEATNERNIPGTSRDDSGNEEDRRRLMETTWSGMTPPSKDRPQSRVQSTPFLRENMTPLKAPELLAHYVDRFNQIQNRLSMNLNSPQT